MAELKKTEEHGKVDCIPGILELIRQCIRVFAHVFVGHVSYLTGFQLAGEFEESGVINGYVPSYVERMPASRACEVERVPFNWRRFIDAPARRDFGIHGIAHTLIKNNG